MHDGRTRKVEAEDFDRAKDFLEAHRVSLTLMSGPEAGLEWAIEGARTVAGRSEKAIVRLDEPSVSSEHAAFEVDERGLGVRDLASTNGVTLNGTPILSAPLVHGDRLRLGDCELQVVVEEREAAPRVWSLSEEA